MSQHQHSQDQDGSERQDVAIALLTSQSSYRDLHFHDLERPLLRSMGAVDLEQASETIVPTIPKDKSVVCQPFWEESSLLALPSLVVPKKLQPLPWPPYIEQFTSFITMHEADDVVYSICNIFNDSMAHQMDYTRSETKPKISGVIYHSVGACTFKIKVYADVGNTHRVVEFQRRSGDTVAFADFYRKTVALLGSIVARPFVTPSLSLIATRPSALLPHPKPTHAPDMSMILLDDATIECLLDMLGSKDSDVQRESIRSLANALQYPSNQQKMISNAKIFGKFVQQLIGLISSKNKEIVRCVVTVIEHLAQQETARPELMKLSASLLHLLDLNVNQETMNSIQYKEVRRQTALALTHLTLTCKTDFLKDAPSHLAILNILDRQLKASQDPILTKHLELCCKNLDVVLSVGY